jgi:hypothetical protein
MIIKHSSSKYYLGGIIYAKKEAQLAKLLYVLEQKMLRLSQVKLATSHKEK